MDGSDTQPIKLARTTKALSRTSLRNGRYVQVHMEFMDDTIIWNMKNPLWEGDELTVLSEREGWGLCWSCCWVQDTYYLAHVMIWNCKIHHSCHTSLKKERKLTFGHTEGGREVRNEKQWVEPKKKIKWKHHQKSRSRKRKNIKDKK